MSDRIPMLVPNSAYLKRVLHSGMSGVDVIHVQETLEDLNQFYKFCPSKNLKPSGYFGEDTRKFVRFFQYYADLIPDGFVDRATSEAMEATWRNFLIDSIMIPGKSKKDRGF